jgi:AF4/FMR2 family member 2
MFERNDNERNSHAILSTLLSRQVHQAYQRQGVFFNYLMSCHDLWEQADTLVSRGNHTGKSTTSAISTKSILTEDFSTFADFFIELDHENGPITLHSTLNCVVKYVQAGIQKLRRNVNIQRLERE